MADELLNLPDSLPESIATFMRAQKYVNGMAIRNTNNLAKTIAENPTIVTAEVFQDILKRNNLTEMGLLPAIYTVRNEVALLVKNGVPATPTTATTTAASTAVATAPAESSPTPAADPAPAPAADPAPADALSDGFGEPLAPPPAKRLSAAGNDPVLTKATADDISAAFAAAPAAVTAELDEMIKEVAEEMPPPPAPTIDVEAETVVAQPADEPAELLVEPVVTETPTVVEEPTPGETPKPTEEEKHETPTRRRRASAASVNDGESVVKALLLKLDEANDRISKLEKALAEANSSSMKLSAATAKRLAELGIEVE